MQRANLILSRQFCLTGLVIAVFVSGVASPAAHPTRSDEGFLAMALLKTRLQKERIEADIEAAEADLRANTRTIQAAEERIAIAIETGVNPTGRVREMDLQNARGAKRKIKKTLSRLESARATAEDAYAIVREMLILREGREPNSRILGMVSPSSKQVVITKNDGRRILLKPDKPGFLESGDEVSTKGAGGAEMLFLDGRGTVQLDGGSRLKIEEAASQEQVLQLVQGRVQLAVESPEDLRNQLRERAQRSDDDLNLVLKRYRGLSGSDFARLFEKDLRMKISGAVCAARRTRFTAEVKTEGETEIMVFEGTVEVSDANGQKHIVVNNGFGAVVTKDGLSGPRRLPIQNRIDPPLGAVREHNSEHTFNQGTRNPFISDQLRQ
jgi:hypothetical protein